MSRKLLALHGLKWNPFTPDLPLEGLLMTPQVEHFCWRMATIHVREGGFALVRGDVGTGKSVGLRLLHDRLSRERDVTVGALEHPQCSLGDFYRELGDLFGVPLKPSNRWGGFKGLRAKWQEHVDKRLTRPVLIVDEAQEMSAAALNELRLLSSACFDSRSLLSVVIAGDRRLDEQLNNDKDLAPLASRIRTRLVLEPASRDELMAYLKHVTSAAGNARLLTTELMGTLCDHALGNYRALMIMAADLLAAAVQREQTQLDEKLFLEVFAVPSGPKAAPPARNGTKAKR
jgi:type II secretory pathway predicted ATPase ExeA